MHVSRCAQPRFDGRWGRQPAHSAAVSYVSGAPRADTMGHGTVSALEPAMKTFADLVAGRVARHVIYEDEEHLAVLAPSPVKPGHTLVLTKRAHPYVFDLSEAEHAALWKVAQRVARHLKSALPCERVCVAVVGWEVRHVHVHLVPTDRGGEFPPLPGTPAQEGELTALRQRLSLSD